MSWSTFAAAFMETVKRLVETCAPTVDEQAKIDRAKAEKGFLKWLKKTETSSKKDESGPSDGL